MSEITRQQNQDTAGLDQQALECRPPAFRPIRLVLFVSILIFAISQWISWYSREVSLPRYCDNPQQALHYLEKIIRNKQPAGDEPRKPYLIAAKILYIIPQQSDEDVEVYLNRVHNRLLHACN